MPLGTIGWPPVATSLRARRGREDHVAVEDGDLECPRRLGCIGDGEEEQQQQNFGRRHEGAARCGGEDVKCRGDRWEYAARPSLTAGPSGASGRETETARRWMGTRDSRV
ncbi:hypothetical protein ABZP36_021489 [Zizania latifolia]